MTRPLGGRENKDFAFLNFVFAFLCRGFVKVLEITFEWSLFGLRQPFEFDAQKGDSLLLVRVSFEKG